MDNTKGEGCSLQKSTGETITIPPSLTKSAVVSEDISGKHRYLIIANVCKRNNVKTLISTALAFNFTPLVVGLQSILDELHREDFRYMQVDNMQELEEYLESKRVHVMAIEISDTATSLLDNPWKSDAATAIALMPGNEGFGLSKTQRKICHSMVYIPQYGVGTASLNVTVATSIVLSQYNEWAKRLDEI
jgi:tRNA(Leu) C34 or U34 (ribose-2'-O)-methylase TrmL